MVEPPIWNICEPSNWIISPSFGVKLKNLCHHHLLSNIDWLPGSCLPAIHGLPSSSSPPLDPADARPSLAASFIPQRGISVPYLPVPYIFGTRGLPASSKWPFDNPNGGHLAPEKVTRKNLVVTWYIPEMLDNLIGLIGPNRHYHSRRDLFIFRLKAT